WGKYGPVVDSLTLTPGVGDVLGNWQQWTTPESARGLTRSVSTGYAVGDTLALCGRFETNGITFTAHVLATSGSRYTRVVNDPTVAIDGVFYGELLVPEGTTTLEVRLTGGAGIHKVAQVGLYNLTAMGAA